MVDIFHVCIATKAKKDIVKVPAYVARKLQFWMLTVSQIGIVKVRQISGFHDEPLRGKRSHQRSIRLSRKYRAIYETKMDQKMIQFIEIQEVNNHGY